MADNTTGHGEFNANPNQVMRSYNGQTEESLSESNAKKTVDGNNTGTGTLRVQVTTAGGALPINGAKVTIMNMDGSLIKEVITDNSGRTEQVSLPTPPFEYSQKPGSLLPYSTYNVRVEIPGFYTEEFLNIAVFDRTESIQQVALEPLGENATENDRFLVIDESMPDVL